MAEDSGQQKTPDARILKKSTPSTQNMKSQKSILGFFQKSSPSASAASPACRNDASQEPVSSPAQRAASNQKSHKKPEPKLPRSLNTRRNKTVTSSGQSITRVPSSDATGYCEQDAEVEVSTAVNGDGKTEASTESAADGGLVPCPSHLLTDLRYRLTMKELIEALSQLLVG